MNGDESAFFRPWPPVFIMNAQELAKLNMSEEVVRRLLGLQVDLAERISAAQASYLVEVRKILGLEKSY